MDQFIKVPSVLMRGGTSKGLIFKSVHLPSDPVLRDKLITRIYGSPDLRQIDGLGGGNPLSSKMAIVGPSTHPDADINYTFGQVSLEQNVIDYKPTCGNMATAVGLFAAEEGYVSLTDPVAVVRIFNTNTNKIIETEVHVKNGSIDYNGNFAIDGVPGTSSQIMVNFLDPGGAITGKLLPTGNVKDLITLDNGERFQVSVIDSANAVVFVSAEELGIKGPDFVEAFKSRRLLDTLELIRVEAGIRIGLIENNKEVTPSSHALPKIAVLAKAQNYHTATGRKICEDKVDIIGLYLAMGQLHQAFAVSGGITVATGSQIPGTIVEGLLKLNKRGMLTIGHPSGTMAVDVQVKEQGGLYQVTRAAVGRTARRLMDGVSYVPSYVNNEKHG
ncbi:2-methylaconitate cis-trans isomerase PrpF family protein [Paenibacillus periandrae]|uniref:2-methylaconitate cis-trans isomerase PrpF family protein n=1 Tax=Paenibacillus periandrae TaxID=1761741 RepID=UPI001F0904B6|nr:PrpF domain-containing protein [Paenibacillus periandrae]